MAITRWSTFAPRWRLRCLGSDVKRVAVIGAGLAGLAAAWQLVQDGFDAVVFESMPRAGGVVHSSRIAGYLVEDGPNTIAALPAGAANLLGALGLLERRVFAPREAKRRYVVRRGQLAPLPGGPLEFLSTPSLSWPGKLRLLGEPLAGRSSDPDETVAAFARRRLGADAAAYLIDPFIAGVYAGRPEELLVRHALPMLWRMEQTSGSLFRGVLSARRSRRGGSAPDRRIWSLPNGLGEIPAALAGALGNRIRLECQVRTVARQHGQWVITAGDGAAAIFDALIWAAPAHQVELLAGAADPTALQLIAALPYAPIAVLALGFRRDALSHSLDGFGLLVPSTERRPILGTLFSSTLAPDRAPAGHVLLTTFIGGTRNPDLARDDAGTQTSRVVRELEQLLGVRGEPTFRHYVQWPRAIPQYGPAYAGALAAIARLEGEFPTLGFAGNYRGGVAAGNALASGLDAAARLAARLTPS